MNRSLGTRKKTALTIMCNCNVEKLMKLNR